MLGFRLQRGSRSSLRPEGKWLPYPLCRYILEDFDQFQDKQKEKITKNFSFLTFQKLLPRRWWMFIFLLTFYLLKNLKSGRISQLLGNISLVWQQSRALTRWSEQGTGVTLPAHRIGLRNYPSRESQIPSQMGRTHFPPFSEWKAESAWPEPRSYSNPRPRNATPRTSHLTRTPVTFSVWGISSSVEERWGLGDESSSQVPLMSMSGTCP